MKKRIDCLTDCDAFCCRRSDKYRIIFDLSEAEAVRMKVAGTRLSMMISRDREGGYALESDCGVLAENRCRWHESDLQPECCQNNLAGKEVCRWVRGRALSLRRYSEVE